MCGRGKGRSSTHHWFISWRDKDVRLFLIIYHHKQDAGIVWNINQLKVDLIVGEKPRKGCEGRHDSLEGDDRLFHIAVKEED